MRVEPHRRLCTLFLVLGAVAVSAQDPIAALDAATRAYESGNFSRAVELYEQAIDEGAGGALVHYNLGNAHFKTGDLGPAIASYVRAQRLAPRDERIRTNLRVARAQIRDRELTDAQLPAALAPVRWTYDRFSLDEWWTVAILVFAALVAVAIAGQWTRLGPGAVRRTTLALGVVLAVAVAMGLVRYRSEVARDSAVVVAQQVEVRSGPGRDYNLAFRIHEGLQVHVAERRDDWLRIDLGGELVGWVPASVLELL